MNLLPDNAAESLETQIYDADMKRIFVDTQFNSRGAITALDVHELAKQIARDGLISPVTIQVYNKVPGHDYRLIAGYRRFLAHQVNNATHIRATVKLHVDDMRARVINLAENIQRSDLTIKQEAEAIRHLRLGGWSQNAIADEIGKSRGWVQIRFMLMDLPQEVQDEAAAGFINTKQIQELWQLGTYDEQMAYVKQIKDTRILGKKRMPSPENVRKINGRKVRGLEEILALQEIIQDALAINDHPMAIALGWATGYVDDRAMHEAIAAEAKKESRFYIIPAHLKEAVYTDTEK